MSSYKALAKDPALKSSIYSARHPNRMSFSYEVCPVCPWWSIKVVNGRIVRHERGLGYIPYKWYRGLHRKYPNDPSYTVREQMRRQLCPASGKTLAEARKLGGK